MNMATFNDKTLVGYFISAPQSVLEILRAFMDGNFYTVVYGIQSTSFTGMGHIFPNRCVAVVCKVVRPGYIPVVPRYAYRPIPSDSEIAALLLSVV